MERLEGEAPRAPRPADRAGVPVPDVLVVDDDEKNLRALAALLSELPCRVVLARSGEEALRILMRQDVAVILLDVQMPGIDGLELAGMIRARIRSQRTPIIFITAFSRSHSQLRRAYALGAVDFLTKPIEPAEILRDKVAWFVESRRAAQLLEIERERARAAEVREHERAVENAKRLGEAAALKAEMARQAELVDRLNRSNERLAVLSSVANELIIQPNASAALPAVFGRLAEHLGIELFLAHLAGEDGLTLFSQRGLPDPAPDALARVDGRAFAGLAARRAPLVVAEPAGANEAFPALGALALRAAAIFPLVERERFVGTLTFGTRRRGRIEPDELSMLGIVSDEIAMRLEREQLISELKQRMRDLSEADRRKDEFLAMLAHELRNPLAPILNAIEILRREGPPSTVGRRALEAGDRQVRHLVRLVGDLVDVSRIRTGKVDLQRSQVDLARIVEDAVVAVEPVAREHRHEISIDLPAAPVLLQGDGVRLTQVLENLLHNAAKYTESGGHIRLSAALDERGDVVVRVADDGMGISAELLPRVFDTFVQGEQPPHRARGGLGLGLTLVKTLVELHGGAVSAWSPGPGRGSTFEVRLPASLRVHEPAPAGRNGAAAERADGAAAVPLRVAIIEDNPDIRETLRDLLRMKGHEVVEAEDGPGGVQLVISRRPDVALVDIGLPGIDGFEVAAQLRSAARKTCLVALTGYGGEEDRKRAARAGFDAHLVKPVDFQDLSRVLDRLAAAARAADPQRPSTEGAAPCPS